MLKIVAADATLPADVLVVVADGDRILASAGTLTASARRGLAAARSAVAAGELCVLPGSVLDRDGAVIVAALSAAPTTSPGAPDGVRGEELRRAVGAALRSVDRAATVAVLAPDADPATLGAIAEGARLGAYRFAKYRAAPGPRAISIVVEGPVSREQRAAVTRAGVVADAVCLARDLVNTAPNDLGPADLAAIAVAQGEKAGLAVKVWDDRALRRGGFGGLTAVGQGSARGPRLVRLSYTPARGARSVALVGKGITFDSGGLSLKPAKAMEWMKADMGGAAAVLGTVVAAARLKVPVTVTGWLALAENMPSGTAQRPGDVITIRGGTTVEVLNTDAEGRLVLADAIVEAVKEEPDELVDIATLTGAQLVALGSRVAGAMGNDEALRDGIVAAAGAAGESFWPMPLPPELRPSLDSPIADLANIGDRNGGMLTAALFLADFVPAELPWTHLDIAGPAFNESPAHDYTPKGGTGFGVRTLVRHLQNLA